MDLEVVENIDIFSFMESSLMSRRFWREFYFLLIADSNTEFKKVKVPKLLKLNISSWYVFVISTFRKLIKHRVVLLLCQIDTYNFAKLNLKELPLKRR